MSERALLAAFRSRYESWMEDRLISPRAPAPDPQHWEQVSGLPAALARAVAADCHASALRGYARAWTRFREALARGIAVMEPPPSVYKLTPDEAAKLQAALLTSDEVLR